MLKKKKKFVNLFEDFIRIFWIIRNQFSQTTRCFATHLLAIYLRQAGFSQTAIETSIAVINCNIVIGLPKELSIKYIALSGVQAKEAAFSFPDFIDKSGLAFGKFIHNDFII